MLPNFLIIGTTKAATTWLAKEAGNHPEIFLTPVKETNFFNKYYEKGIDWYESQYFSKWAGEKAIGEATPVYLYQENVPGRIRTELGEQVKLIASLRHPVDRAYSAFWMFLSRGRIPANTDFLTYFRTEKQFGLRLRGCYSSQVKRYLDHFSRENLLFLIYEEIKTDNRQAIRSCFEFLGVDPDFVSASQEKKVNQGIDVCIFNKGMWRLRRVMKRSLPYRIDRFFASIGRPLFDWIPKNRYYRSLDEEIRQELLAEFNTDIQKLEDILGRDLSVWYGSTKKQTSVKGTNRSNTDSSEKS